MSMDFSAGPERISPFQWLFAAADQSLFERMLRNELHVLQPLLPEKKMISNCNLRPRQHDRQLIRKSAHINDSVYYQNAVQRLLLTSIVTPTVSFATSFVYFSCMYSRCDLSTEIFIRIYGSLKPVLSTGQHESHLCWLLSQVSHDGREPVSRVSILWLKAILLSMQLIIGLIEKQVLWILSFFAWICNS